MGYTLATIRALVQCGAEVHIVHWDQKKASPYVLEKTANTFFYPRSSMTANNIYSLAQSIEPNMVVVSGWMDKEYLKVARKLKREGIPVVAAIDNQWRATIKQRVACLNIFRRIIGLHFSHIWVPGLYQYEYVRKLGFDRNHIKYDFYSADVDLFHRNYRSALSIKTAKYPHKFLFVGRMEYIKGVDILLRAWEICADNRKDWQLQIIGNGSLAQSISKVPGITYKSFIQPQHLVSEATSSGCFVLPSRSEPWGVVLHEFASAGLPLLASDSVGASTMFLINGLNGYSFRSEDPHDLANAILHIINSSDETLLEMSAASHMLSNRITPRTSASNLISIMRSNKLQNRHKSRLLPD